MNELFELRVYPEPSDAYEKDSRYWLLDKKISLKECEKILSDFIDYIYNFHTMINAKLY